MLALEPLAIRLDNGGEAARRLTVLTTLPDLSKMATVSPRASKFVDMGILLESAPRAISEGERDRQEQDRGGWLVYVLRRGKPALL